MMIFKHLVKIIRFLLNRKVITATLLMMLFFFKIMPLVFIVDFFDITESVDQLYLEDYSFHEKQREVDTNIVLINLGNLSRKEIAKQLSTINFNQPKVVGLEAYFLSPKDKFSDSLLAESMSKVKNLVLPVKAEGYPRFNGNELMIFDSVTSSCEMFTKYALQGYNSLNHDDINNTVRTFSPQIFVRENKDSKNYMNFAVQIANCYDSQKVSRLLSRGKSEEYINYAGGKDLFKIISYEELTDSSFDLSVIKGKIVLMGYLSDNKYDVINMFYTPLNNGYNSLPDMNGVVIHANIINSILEENYINSLDNEIYYLVTFVYIYLLLLLFHTIFIKRRNSYDLASKSIAVFLSILLFYLDTRIFIINDFRINSIFFISITMISSDFLEIYLNNIHNKLKKLINLFLPKKYKLS